MLSLTRRIPRLARARARLEDHRADIIDGRDLVRLAERELMSPLDIEARRLVVAASKRVSVVTAISPRAAVDMVFVLINALRLVRQLAVLYGGRPGALGVLRLLRQVVSHLAVTGGVALADSVVQQVIGHGHRRAAVGPAGRGHGQRPPDRPAGPPDHRSGAAAAVPRTAAAGAERSGRHAAAARRRATGGRRKTPAKTR